MLNVNEIFDEEHKNNIEIYHDLLLRKYVTSFINFSTKKRRTTIITEGHDQNMVNAMEYRYLRQYNDAQVQQYELFLKRNVKRLEHQIVECRKKYMNDEILSLNCLNSYYRDIDVGLLFKLFFIISAYRNFAEL